MVQMAHDDDEAMRLVYGDPPSSSSASGPHRYLYVEYLDWMDPDKRVLVKSRGGGIGDADTLGGVDGIEDDKGEIKCRHCRRAIGGWTWVPTPSQCLYGQLDPPLFRILKNCVNQADFPLDPTPQSTPREGDGSGPGYHSTTFTHAGNVSMEGKEC
jgi:hypothetical protein